MLFSDRGSRVFSNSENIEDCGDRHQRSSLAESLSERNHNSKSTQTHLTSQESPEIKKRNSKKSKIRFPRSSSPEDEGYDPALNATPNHSPKMSLKAQQQAKSIQTLSEKEMRELEEQLRFVAARIISYKIIEFLFWEITFSYFHEICIILCLGSFIHAEISFTGVKRLC